MSQPPTEHADTPAFEGAPSPFVVEWYRLDQRREINRAFIIAAALLVPGSILVAVAVAPFGLPPVARFLVSSLGFLLTAGGPAWAIFGLRRVITADGFIALRTDGLLCDVPSHRGLVPWDEVEEVSAGDPGVRLTLRTGGPVVLAERFHRLAPPDLVLRLREVQRRALWRTIPGMR